MIEIQNTYIICFIKIEFKNFRLDLLESSKSNNDVDHTIFNGIIIKVFFIL